MPNYENFLVYEHWQYDVIRHLFAFTVACFAAGLVYFIVTANQIAPRYRLSAYISGVVMVSAALEVFNLWLLWNQTFDFQTAASVGTSGDVGAVGAAAAALVPEGMWVRNENTLFSNGYRYVNWSIDVPMLLTQLLVVLGFQGDKFWHHWRKLTILGLLMVWTGYVGQFYEPQTAGLVPGSQFPFWAWGAVSTVFFVWLAFDVSRRVREPQGPISERANTATIQAFWFLIATWSIYPFAYMGPAFAEGGILPLLDANTSVFVRQVLYTTADITSKLIFGVMLGRIARMRSMEEGWEPAIKQELSPHEPLEAQVPPLARRKARETA